MRGMRLVDRLRRWVAPAAARELPDRRAAVDMSDDWEAELNYRYGGQARVSAREAADALARDLREMPAISIAELVGHKVWCTDGREWPGNLLLLPRATAITDYAYIRRVPAEDVTCGDCGRGLLLADAWLAKGRIVCSTCVGTKYPIAADGPRGGQTPEQDAFLEALGQLDALQVWGLAAERLGPNYGRAGLTTDDPLVAAFAARASSAATRVALSHIFDLTPEHSLPHGPAADAAHDIAIAMADPHVDPDRREELLGAWRTLVGG